MLLLTCWKIRMFNLGRRPLCPCCYRGLFTNVAPCAAHTLTTTGRIMRCVFKAVQCFLDNPGSAIEPGDIHPRDPNLCCSDHATAAFGVRGMSGFGGCMANLSRFKSCSYSIHLLPPPPPPSKGKTPPASVLDGSFSLHPAPACHLRRR